MKLSLEEVFKLGQGVAGDGPLFGPGCMVKDELFIPLKEREAQTDLENIDEDFISVFEAFKGIPHLAAVWSCSGHKDNPRGYVFFVGREKEQRKVDETVKSLITEAWEQRLPYRGVMVEYLRNPQAEGFNDDDWYPGFMVEWEYDDRGKNKENLDRFARVLESL